jgi:hypothetical protein
VATRLRWLLGSFAAAVLIALLVRSVDLQRWTSSTAADVRRERSLAAELRQANARLREAVQLDSLMPLLPDEPGLRVRFASFVARGVADSIRDAATRQLAEIGSLQARTGLFVVPATLGTHTAWADVATSQFTYYAGVDDAGAYCFAVAAARSTDSTLQRLVQADGKGIAGAPLGPCFYWARYGAPGTRMQQWLRDSGYRFGEVREVPADRDGVRPARRRIFGLRDWSGRSLFGDACLAGDTRACVTALTRAGDHVAYGALPADALPVYERAVYRSYAFGPAERALLADLERSFGPDRFAGFWSNTEPFDAAFAAAFGRPLGAWVHEWATQHHPATRPMRAAPDLWTVVLSVLVMAALCGAALVTAHRRQVR